MTPAFFTLHRDLPREGPGSAAEVHWTLEQIPRPSRIIDAACGPGADTVTFAEALPEARIEGVDITPHFVSEAQAATRRFAPRVSIRQGDMRNLTGPANLIWCAGALYAVGLESALPLWRKALAPGGHVAFSEPVVLTDPPSRAAQAFWEGYKVGTAETIAARVASAGYRSVRTRLQTGRPWAEYYEPMQRRIAALRPGASPEVTKVLDDAQKEIDLWRAAPAEVAYLLTIAEPA